MHILFIGYGKTSQRIAKHLFAQGHQITAVSRHPKPQDFVTHLTQDIHQLNLDQCSPIDWVYVLLAPENSDAQSYKHTYLDSVQPIARALATHPVKRVVVVSSTRVYGQQQAGEIVNDQTIAKPVDQQGAYLLEMEEAWQNAFAEHCTIIRPSGIYGNSISRMVKLAKNTTEYPVIHYSNRIHIEDLARFLAFMTQMPCCQPSYLISDVHPYPLHEIILWFQKQLALPQLVLQSDSVTGKRIVPVNFLTTGFELQAEDCFEIYGNLLRSVDT